MLRNTRPEPIMASEPISGVAVEAGVSRNEFVKPDCVTDPVCACSDVVSVIRNVPTPLTGITAPA